MAKTILADLDPREHAALHARALAVLPFSAAPEPSVVAHHVLRARGLVPSTTCAQRSSRPHRAPDRRLAWEDSVLWWRHAVELGASGVGLGRALLRCGGMEPAAGPSGPRPLRPEQEVLRLIAQGLTNKAIATSLHLSVHTVERHVVNLLRKVGAGNRTEATAWAHAQGLVD